MMDDASTAATWPARGRPSPTRQTDGWCPNGPWCPGRQWYGFPPPRRTDGMALAAMVVGVASLFWLWATILVPAVAVALGVVGLSRVRRSSYRLAGQSMAIVGVVLGVVGVAGGVTFWSCLASGLSRWGWAG